MELKYFRLIVSIAEEGSLTRAAEKLCLTQSALSHQLKEMEMFLGLSVFYRVNKKLIPTASGAKLLKEGKRILSEINKTMESIGLDQLRTVDTIKMLVECYSSFFWLPKILHEFSIRYPSTEIIINSDLSHDYSDDLINNAYDIALVVNKKANRELEFQEILLDKLVIAMSDKNPLVKNLNVRFDALRNQTVVTHCKPNETREIFEHIEPPEDFKLHKVIQVTATEGIFDLIDEGIGVAILSEWVAKKYCSGRNIVLRPFEKEKSERPWYLARKKHMEADSRLDYFTELIRKYGLQVK